MSTTQQLALLLATRSVKTGQFTLASGRQSNIYVDARLTTMSPEGLSLIGSLGLRALQDSGWNIDAVGGLTLGADPVSYAISMTSNATSRPLRAFTVRKEAKAHGTAKLIEGPVSPGDRVAIVEDVVTTGQSAMKAAEAARTAGMSVAGVIAVVDREEGGREIIEAAGLPVITLAAISDIMVHLGSTRST